jgi:hypothetical protein
MMLFGACIPRHRGRGGDDREGSSMDYVVAQVNVGRLVAPVDSPRVADFVAQLDPVNAVADSAPGFLWRLQTEEGNATSLRVLEEDGEDILVNMSVWESVEALAAYVYGEAHRAVLRRRREWFEPLKDAYVALWWIPRGHIPTVAEAEERVRYLRAHGPTPHAFTIKVHFPAPDAEGGPDAVPVLGSQEWACTV